MINVDLYFSIILLLYSIFLFLQSHISFSLYKIQLYDYVSVQNFEYHRVCVRYKTVDFVSFEKFHIKVYKVYIFFYYTKCVLRFNILLTT